ncbi:GNAT family N-acetyltransferase [Methyloligella solikamskensis]|uniref:GNAT family N-acetyltransferase n=1 Tax=Methyloligella solikamskensis TaxID=1177756 RepID=A0ABW3J9M0_9HYPH
MSAQVNRELALRPMLPSDVAVLATIFRESVMELTGDDYSEAQQEAWIKSAEDEAAFATLLSRHVTIVATLNGAPVGFASLESDDKIGFLYVHPSAAGYGAGMMLADALEKLASSRKAGALSVDASDTAYGFFAKRGYEAQQRNQVQRADEWLATTTMRKELPAYEGVH